MPDLTIAQNLRLARTPPDVVRRWLGRFGFASLDFGTVVRGLPLPTLRLIDLARALAAEPDILLLDEITAALPPDLAEHVYAAAREWRALGRSVIFISHRLAEIAALCDRATVLRDGVTVGVVEPAQGGEERIVALMLGAPPESAARDRRGRGGAAIRRRRRWRCRGCAAARSCATCRSRCAPAKCSAWRRWRGRGRRSCSTALPACAAPMPAPSWPSGARQQFRHPADAIRAGLVLVPADRVQALLPQRSVHENIALPLVRRLRDWGGLPMRAERARVADAVRRLQIDTRAAAEVKRLSGGNQQKVVIARWLACGFRTLLCFDPTRGIDIGTKRQIYALLREIAASGAAVLLFTSELSEIPLACDRVAVLFGGRVVAEMPAAGADEATLLRAAHGLAAREDAAA